MRSTPFVLAVLFSLSACTSILGDFEVEDGVPVLGHKRCESDEECSEKFYPGSVCIAETGKCRAYLGGDAGDGATDAASE